jgi:uncharacterized membrane protein
MTESPSRAELAERLGRKRARLLPLLGMLFLIQQTAYFAHGDGARTVDHVRLGAWAVMGLVLLFVLMTGGFFFRGRAVRDLLNDEVTKANRAAAIQWGFVAAMLVGILLYVIQALTQVTAREALHLTVSTGLVVALVRFGALERRAHG